LVFHSSTIAMMHGPINIRSLTVVHDLLSDDLSLDFVGRLTFNSVGVLSFGRWLCFLLQLRCSLSEDGSRTGCRNL